MGCGTVLKCSKCHKEYEILTGIGMLYPLVYSELLDDIKNGKYGKEWQDIALKTPHVAVDAEKHVYSCRKCGAWKTEEGLSIYEPDDYESLNTKRYGHIPVEERGDDPFVLAMNHKKDYHVVKRYVHKCDKCGSRMHRVNENEFHDLPCPECGGKPEKGYNSIILWD